MKEPVLKKSLRPAPEVGNGTAELTLAEQLLQEGAQRDRETITWKDRKILVIEPSLEARDHWLDLLNAEVTGEDKEGNATAVAKGSLAKANAYLCVVCAHHPETEAPLFRMDQQRDLAKLATQSFVEPVAKAVTKLMKRAESAGNDSSETETDSSDSVSPPS